MKKLLIIVTMSFAISSLSYGVTITSGAEAVTWVNTQASEMIDILNLSLTKLNITSCDSLAVGRANDSFTISVEGSWVGEAAGINPAFRMITVYEAPVKAGMERRVKIYTESDTTAGGAPQVLPGNLGAIVEFTCDMKKGFFVQTGNQYQLLVANWDNTLTVPSVIFKLVGTDNGNGDGTGTDTNYMFTKNDVRTFATGAQVMTAGNGAFNNLLSYLKDFSVVYRGPTCQTTHDAADTAALTTAGCAIKN